MSSRRTTDGVAAVGGAARSETPAASILVLTGTVHARTTPGVPWDPSFLPMGALLARVIPGVVSFNAEHATGSAWACMMEDKCGEQPVKGTDGGPSPTVLGLEKTGWHLAPCAPRAAGCLRCSSAARIPT